MAIKHSVNALGSLSLFFKSNPNKMTAMDFFSLSIGKGSLSIDGADHDLHDINKITVRLSEIHQDSSSSSRTDGTRHR